MSELPEIIGNLDSLVEPIVILLRVKGIPTFASCQGGPSHSFLLPTIRFLAETKDEVLRVGQLLVDNRYHFFVLSLEITSWRFNRKKSRKVASRDIDTYGQVEFVSQDALKPWPAEESMAEFDRVGKLEEVMRAQGVEVRRENNGWTAWPRL